MIQLETEFEAAVDAVISGDTAALKKLLQSNPSLATAHAPHLQGNATLLHYVAANGVDGHHQKTPPNAVEVAQILFDAGADANATCGIYGSGGGSTPLVGLVSSSHPHIAGLQTQLIHVFCKNGANINGIDGDGLPLATALEFWYPLAFKALVECGGQLINIVFAAAAGREDIVIEHLESGITLKESAPLYKDAFGNTWEERDATVQFAFVKACLCGQQPIIEMLLDKGLDVNTSPRKRTSGLHEAAYAGELEVVQFLFEHDADTNLRDRQFDSLPIHWAYAASRHAVFDYLLPKTTLSIADYAEFGMVDDVQRLLASNRKLANGDNGNGQPLREAANRGHTAVVKLLLEYGANPSLQSQSGQTALDLADKQGHIETADVLRDTMW